ncbi:MAG: DegT/DnrJ/EryC1/StrS family aminotransferase [Deltaproteobacteria bacterium]|nr:DegT/DnrJ/EryC1/StrS family aminotransferase [Deltaproteobacteria bacterium]
MSDKSSRIPVAGPSITELEVSYVAQAARDGWFANSNFYQEQFEAGFASYVNRKYAVCLPSCTAAIHLALLSLEIKSGDEVIVPDITWIASAAPISYVQATPVFADIDPKSWCISTDSIIECISDRTKAVIAVDLYGAMPDYEKITSICNDRNLVLIEDAAQAIGSSYRSRKAGSFGDVSVFSFHGSKTLTTGEGGMLVTDREDIYKRVLFLRDHGRSSHRLFWNEEVAFKYKMSAMQAALGYAQLQRIDQLVQHKRKIFHWYREALKDAKEVILNPEIEGCINSYWMTTAIIDSSLNLDKERTVTLFSRHNIDCRPFFYPLSSMPAYQSNVSGKNTVAYTLSPYGVNLPSALSLSENDVLKVADCFKAILKSNRITSD